MIVRRELVCLTGKRVSIMHRPYKSGREDRRSLLKQLSIFTRWLSTAGAHFDWTRYFQREFPRLSIFLPVAYKLDGPPYKFKRCQRYWKYITFSVAFA